MAAVNGAATAAEDEFDELVRGAQDRLRRAEELARLADDPATEGYRALAAHLEVLAGHHRLEKQRINTRLEVIDGRLDEIHQIHAELREVAATAAKAEIGKTEAELARVAAQQIAVAAARQLKTMTRTSWLRAVSAAVAVGVVAFVAGAALGVAWGGSAAARHLATADAVVHFVAAKEGLRYATGIR